MAKLSYKWRMVSVLFVLLFIFGDSAMSQSSDQLGVLQRIYSGLAKQFVTSPNSFLILFDPGITIDGWFDPKSDQLQKRLLQIADESLRPQPVFAATSGRASSVYEQILREGQWGQLILDQTQQQQMADANKALYKDSVSKTPTAGYAQYLQLTDRYTKAQASWDSTPEDKRTEKMRAELDAASRDLELRGNAPLYQGALETLASISGTQPSNLRDRWVAQLEGATTVASGGTRVFPGEVVPALALDYSRRWTALTIDQTPTDPSVTNLLWQSNFVGPWRLCGSSTFADGDDRQPTSALSPTVTLEAKAFSISRPWMDDALFAYRGWKSKDTSTIVSSGDSPLTGHPTGLLPLMVTEIIIARNISVDGGFAQAELSRISNQVQARKCSAFGPFVVTGETDFGNTLIPSFPFGGGFYIPTTQIVAVVASVVVKSPDPDSSHYTWQ